MSRSVNQAASTRHQMYGIGYADSVQERPNTGW